MKEGAKRDARSISGIKMLHPQQRRPGKYGTHLTANYEYFQEGFLECLAERAIIIKRKIIVNERLNRQKESFKHC